MLWRILGCGLTQVLEAHPEAGYSDPVFFTELDRALIGNLFNRALYVPDIAPLPEEQILNPRLDYDKLQVRRQEAQRMTWCCIQEAEHPWRQGQEGHGKV
jgi:hypothetical protein